MLHKAFSDYYTEQIGTGLTYYQGNRYHQGRGVFSSFLAAKVLPLLKYLGKTALSTGLNIGKDYLSGENIKSSLKTNLKGATKKILSDAIEKTDMIGSGRKRGRKKRRGGKKSTLNSKLNSLLKKKSKPRRKRKSKKTKTVSRKLINKLKNVLC